MPTIDSKFLDEQWIQTYNNANYILSYSDFGINTLQEESNGLIRLSPNGKLHPKAMRTGVDPKIFKPQDKRAVKSEWSINPEIPIVLIVSRNQQRKLILDDIDAFAQMKNKYEGIPEVDKSILLIHSAWPDNSMSFNYPRHVMRLSRNKWAKNYRKGLWKDVWTTFMCHNCQDVFTASVAVFEGKKIVNNRIMVDCPACGKKEVACSPNTSLGVSREKMAELYSLGDVLVQNSIAEGDGIPATEAKAVGTPLIAIDYASLAEKVRYPSEYKHLKNFKKSNRRKYSAHLGGDPLAVKYMRHEPETGCWRAYGDVEQLSDLMYKYLVDHEYRNQKSEEAIKSVKENYNWDDLAKEWEYVFDNIEPLKRDATWEAPINLVSLPETWPSDSTDEEFVEFCYKEVLKRDPDEQGFSDWLNSLRSGLQREKVFEYFINIQKNKNSLEAARAQALGQELPEEFSQAVGGEVRQVRKVELDKDDKMRILYIMPRTAGDVLLSTAAVSALKKKYPEASIYFSTMDQYADILKGNPDIKQVVPFSEELFNYRKTEGCAQHKGDFEMTFVANAFTQLVPNWLHNGRQTLIDTYGNTCGVDVKAEQPRILTEKPSDEILEMINE